MQRLLRNELFTECDVALPVQAPLSGALSPGVLPVKVAAVCSLGTVIEMMGEVDGLLRPRDGGGVDAGEVGLEHHAEPLEQVGPAFRFHTGLIDVAHQIEQVCGMV